MFFVIFVSEISPIRSKESIDKNLYDDDVIMKIYDLPVVNQQRVRKNINLEEFMESEYEDQPSMKHEWIFFLI